MILSGTFPVIPCYQVLFLDNLHFLQISGKFIQIHTALIADAAMLFHILFKVWERIGNQIIFDDEA
jgi:hypothetical protein